MIRRLAYVVVIAGVLAGCSPGASATPIPTATPTAVTHDVTGTMTLHGDAAALLSTGCTGTGGYDDIRQGTQVTATNQDGTVIGTSALGTGHANADDTACIFGFTLTDLPEASFYSFEVSHRGELRYSAAELEVAGWSVGFSLGN